jgi:hypothetical protein
VKSAILYTMRDENAAYRFGLVDTKGRAKPLLSALRTLLRRPLTGHLPKPKVRLSVSRGRLVVSGAGSITDLYELKVTGGNLRYLATLRTDRFGAFRVVLPAAMGRTGISATFRSTWSKRTARAHR